MIPQCDISAEFYIFIFFSLFLKAKTELVLFFSKGESFSF